MKKKLMSLLAALLVVGALTGCGEGAEEAVDLNEMQIENYVTLGDYQNMTVAVDDASVDDEEWEQLLLAVYQSYVTAENGGVTDRPVEEGDTVIIDYVGKKDGVAFSGGTDSGADLTIGSGQFIEGFEEGLIGVMPGSTVDLDLTFPETFHNAEMAGQAVVFTVTVNYILPGLEEMQDSVVAAQNMEMASNVEELRQYVYDYLMASAEEQRLYSLQNGIMEQLTTGSTIAELPESFVEKYKELYRNSIEKVAADLNTTADVYANYYYGMGSEDFATLYGEVQARQELLLQAIANEQGLKVSDEELETLMSEYAAEAGYDSAEDLQAEIPREQLRNYFMSEKVMEYLIGITNTTSSGVAE